MALQLQQKFLIASISLIPASIGLFLIDAQIEYGQSNDFAVLTLLGTCVLMPLSLLGILLCTIFWKWPEPKGNRDRKQY